MLTDVRWRTWGACVAVAAAVSGCSSSEPTDAPDASPPAVSTCLPAAQNREQWHIAPPRSSEAPEIWVPALPGWEQSRTLDDPDYLLSLVNKPLLGVVLLTVSDVTEEPLPSPQVALDDFMRGLRNRSKAIDGFDPHPAQVCGLTAQQVTYTTQSPNGAINITTLGVAVPNGPKMHLAVLFVEGYEPHNPQFQSDAERFLRESRIVQPT